MGTAGIPHPPQDRESCSINAAKWRRGKRAVDWGMAEALAMGAMLWDGTRVRLTGQDSRRGTFNHRHAVLIDVEDGHDYYPLRHLRDGQGDFTVVDSPLSEAAALGFEYGYSREYPDALVMWGSPIRRFCQRGSDHHRPVPFGCRRQVAAAVRHGSAAAARV